MEEKRAGQAWTVGNEGFFPVRRKKVDGEKKIKGDLVYPQQPHEE